MECVQRESHSVSMRLRRVLKLPETQRPITSSGSSSPVSQPPSYKFMLCGAPGFSLALLDASTAGSNVDRSPSVDRLPVPLPKFGPLTDVVAMTNSEILCVALVGETQIWIGTDSGGVHVFELSTELRLTKPLYCSAEGPVLCVCGFSCKPTTDVVIGTFNGNILVFTGPSDERGGLKDPFRNPRAVVQLGRSDAETHAVYSVVPVNCSGKDTYWCAHGVSIAVVTRSDWKELYRIEGHPTTPPCPPDAEVVQLLSTEVGVWSCLSKCSVISLWSTKTFTALFSFACDTDTSGLFNPVVEVTALSFSSSLLFVGTNAGHLILFYIIEGPQKPSQTNSSAAVQYKFLAGVHCGPHPIVGIEPGVPKLPFRPTSAGAISSPFRQTPVPVQQIVVVCGQDNDDLASTSYVLHYELGVSSYRQSPGGVSPSTGQHQEGRPVSRPRRISLYSVSGGTPLSYLPLPSSSSSINCDCD